MLRTRENLKALRDEAAAWCRGKTWFFYLPIPFYFLYVLFRHLTNPYYASIIHSATIDLHEWGHVIFGPFGHFMAFLGGTLAQISLPLGLMWYFYYRQKDFFAVSSGLGMLSAILFASAVYIADARSKALESHGYVYTTFGGGLGDPNSGHDWYNMLNALGLLQFDQGIAFLVRSFAFLLMAACLFCQGWLLWQMLTGREKTRPTSIWY